MPDIDSATIVRYRVTVTKDDGTSEPVPSNFMLKVEVTAASGAAACKAEQGVMADGGVAVVVTPLKQSEPNIAIVISDPAGALKPFTLNVNIVLGGSGGGTVLSGTLGLDTAAPEITAQPLPPAETPAPNPPAA
jgi:hypothetical protein